MYIYILYMNKSRQVVRKIMSLSINFFPRSVVSPDLLLPLLGLDLILPYRITADTQRSTIQVHYEKRE